MPLRLDRIDAPSWMTEPFVETPEGFLRGRACITNIGVFPYRMADGSIEWELRHPDDVFDSESMDSFRLKPITNDHPSVMVDASNVKEFQVGNLGDNPINGDNIHLTIDMIVQDKKTIEDIRAGKQELSCGYVCEVIDESGVWLGVPYTKRQKNIRGNHVAVVDAARAGEAARIRLDSADAIMVDPTENPVEKIKSDKEAEMPELKKLTLDGIEYQAEESVLVALKTAQDRADAAEKVNADAKTALAAVEAERDTFKDKVDALGKELAEAKASHLDEAAIASAVEKKLALLRAADKHGVELKGDESNEDIQKAVIHKAFPDAKLDGVDAVYLSGRYDGAVEYLDAKIDGDVRVVGGAPAHTDNGSKATEAEKAYRDRLLAQAKK